MQALRFCVFCFAALVFNLVTLVVAFSLIVISL